MEMSRRSAVAGMLTTLGISTAARAQLPGIGSDSSQVDLAAPIHVLAPQNPAEVRAFTVVDVVRNYEDSFRIAGTVTQDPAQRERFITALAKPATRATVAAYVERAQDVYTRTTELLDKGTATASDKSMADLATAVDALKQAESRIMAEGGVQLKLPNPPRNNRTEKVIGSIQDLEKNGIIALNIAMAKGPDYAADATQGIFERRMTTLLTEAGAVEPTQRPTLAVQLKPLISMEITGALHQLRAIGGMVNSGLDRPDPVSRNLFNNVLDQLDGVYVKEKAILKQLVIPGARKAFNAPLRRNGPQFG